MKTATAFLKLNRRGVTPSTKPLILLTEFEVMSAPLLAMIDRNAVRARSSKHNMVRSCSPQILVGLRHTDRPCRPLPSAREVTSEY